MTRLDVNDAVQSLIDRQVEDGRQLGVQVSAFKDGNAVVEAVAGQMGPDDPRPVRPDTLFLSFSMTKGVSALALHQLADRGELDYEAPVAKYWPAFAKNGKGAITVAQAMSHQIGLHAMPEPFAPEHITDWDAGIKRMEEARPAYPPGTNTGYHAVTYGWIVGGIVQGVTGRHIRDVIREEIAKPLGIADEMYVGIDDGLEARLSTLQLIRFGDGLGLAPDHDFYKAMPADMWPHFNSMPMRKACLPSGNGHFTARALARMYAALAGDGSVDGVRLVSRARIPIMNHILTEAPDIVTLAPMKKGIGFMMGGDTDGVPGAMGPRRTAYGHGGAGSSIAFADPEVGLSIAVTLNKMQTPLPGEGTTFEICELIRKELRLT